MPPKVSKTGTDGFSAEERAAMKARATELRAEGKQGAKRADGLQAVLDSIAKMAPEDRALAERVHMTVTAAAPDLSPKTWYGMPAYANADGKIVVYFQNAGKFNYRYSTLGFQDVANLDDGDLWPVTYALQDWSVVVEKKVAELVKAATRLSRQPDPASPHWAVGRKGRLPRCHKTATPGVWWVTQPARTGASHGPQMAGQAR